MIEAPDQLAAVRGLLGHATQRLLGDTITLDDEAWRGPSRLPDWTRGHLATHIARQADAMARLAIWARTGERQQMYASAEARGAEIATGATRAGLDLQVDLDRSADRLAEEFDQVQGADAWNAVVELRDGQSVPARLLPLGRLNEVVLHHVDLDIGFEVDDIPDETATWLLEYCGFRLRDQPDYPALRLAAKSGATVALGAKEHQPTQVTGPAPRLLGWLTGRTDADGLTGADGLQLPAYG